MTAWRFINPLTSFIARSPIHFLITNNILVINFKGRRSKKNYLIPVSYHKHENQLTCVTLRSNLWWKNLKEISQTNLWFKGKLVKVGVHLEYTDDENVKENLTKLVTDNPIDAFFANIKLNKDGIPNNEDLIHASKLHMVLKFIL